MKNTICIVTVCKNSISSIAATMNSVISQSEPPDQYIVIDGASTDGTLEVVEKYSS